MQPEVSIPDYLTDDFSMYLEIERDFVLIPTCY